MSTPSEAAPPKAEVKVDPEHVFASVSAAGPVDVMIKKEEEPDATINQGIPEADRNDDMFHEVDGTDAEDEGYVDGLPYDPSYEGIVEENGVKYFVCAGLKIRQIPDRKIPIYTVDVLYRNIKKGNIVLDPDYQREVVWDDFRSSNLIKSLIMGYYIPPVIFNLQDRVVKQANGKKKVVPHRICVDGKQRLTSIFKFMSGEISFSDSAHPQKKWYWSHPKVDGLEVPSNRNIIPQSLKDFFMQRQLVVVEYFNLTKDTEETMFQLVQRGVALTPAERMRAMSTSWARFSRQYEEDYSMVLKLTKQTRASAFRLVLTIFTMIQEVMSDRRKKNATPSLQASPQALSRVLDDPEPINPVLKLHFKQVFDKYESLIKSCSEQITATSYKVNKNSVFDPAPDFLRGEEVSHVRTFSPLELVATGVLICYYMEERSDEQLLESIKELRHYLRQKHKDLRLNAQCWATAWECISGKTDKAGSRQRRGSGSEGGDDEDHDVGDSQADEDEALSEPDSPPKRRGIKSRPKKPRKPSSKSSGKRHSSAIGSDSPATTSKRARRGDNSSESADGGNVSTRTRIPQISKRSRGAQPAFADRSDGEVDGAHFPNLRKVNGTHAADKPSDTDERSPAAIFKSRDGTGDSSELSDLSDQEYEEEG